MSKKENNGRERGIICPHCDAEPMNPVPVMCRKENGKEPAFLFYITVCAACRKPIPAMFQQEPRLVASVPHPLTLKNPGGVIL